MVPINFAGEDPGTPLAFRYSTQRFSAAARSKQTSELDG
jgi:hypothetical protein